MQIENWHGSVCVWMCLQIMARVWIFSPGPGHRAGYEHGRGPTISDFCRIFSATMFHFWAAKEAIVWRVTGCEWMLGARVKLVDAIVNKCLNWQQSLAHLVICQNCVILNSLIPCHYSLDYNFVSQSLSAYVNMCTLPWKALEYTCTVCTHRCVFTFHAQFGPGLRADRRSHIAWLYSVTFFLETFDE